MHEISNNNWFSNLVTCLHEPAEQPTSLGRAPSRWKVWGSEGEAPAAGRVL